MDDFFDDVEVCVGSGSSPVDMAEKYMFDMMDHVIKNKCKGNELKDVVMNAIMLFGENNWNLETLVHTCFGHENSFYSVAVVVCCEEIIHQKVQPQAFIDAFFPAMEAAVGSYSKYQGLLEKVKTRLGKMFGSPAPQRVQAPPKTQSVFDALLSRRGRDERSTQEQVRIIQQSTQERFGGVPTKVVQAQTTQFSGGSSQQAVALKTLYTGASGLQMVPKTHGWVDIAGGRGSRMSNEDIARVADNVVQQMQPFVHAIENEFRKTNSQVADTQVRVGKTEDRLGKTESQLGEIGQHLAKREDDDAKRHEMVMQALLSRHSGPASSAADSGSSSAPSFGFGGGASAKAGHAKSGFGFGGGGASGFGFTGSAAAGKAASSVFGFAGSAAAGKAASSVFGFGAGKAASSGVGVGMFGAGGFAGASELSPKPCLETMAESLRISLSSNKQALVKKTLALCGDGMDEAQKYMVVYLAARYSRSGTMHHNAKCFLSVLKEHFPTLDCGWLPRNALEFSSTLGPEVEPAGQAGNKRPRSDLSLPPPPGQEMQYLLRGGSGDAGSGSDSEDGSAKLAPSAKAAQTSEVALAAMQARIQALQKSTDETGPKPAPSPAPAPAPAPALGPGPA